jgi:arylsulfatase A-like enzyme/tetratricopeptide (TPR) repeat protein
MNIFRRRKVLLGTIVIALAGISLAAVFLFRAKSPAQRVGRLWARLGVEKPNVLLITLDTTRADHLPCYGYEEVKTPALDALASRGVVFEQCATTTPFTLPAHCSIMTGTYPTYHGVRINGNTALPAQQTTLAEVFSGHGYSCGAFIAAFVLDGRWGLNRGFAHYDDYFDLAKYKRLDLGFVQRPGNVVMDAALAWLEGQKDKPFFAWVHLYDPHAPYEPPEPFYSEYKDGSPVGLYDGEIAFTDKQVGRVISWLQANGLDKKTIVMIVGDHGEGLGEHGESSHGYFIYDSTVHVPFLTVTPFEEFQGLRVKSQVKTVDLFPTLMDLAMIKDPAANQGRSLLTLMARPESGQDSPAYSESLAPNIQFGWGELRSLRTTRYKFVEAPRPELYDLTQDPGETQNLVGSLPKVVREFKADLDKLIKDTSLGAPKPEAANLDRETTERLAALGYIGASASKKPSRTAGGSLADPKDKLPIFQAVQRAGELIFDGKYAEAAQGLEGILSQDPRASQPILLLSTCYSEMGRYREAREKLDLVLQDDPENVLALVSLASILMKEGKREDVIAICKRTLAVDDKTVQAHMLLGEVYMADKDEAQALPYLEKAVEIQPKLSQNNINLAACLIGLKRYERAETLLRGVLKDSPKFPLAEFNLGLLYEEQSRLADARKAYEAELATYPKDFQARFNLGKILLRDGDKDGYLAAMREVMAVAPKRAEGYLFLARGLMSEAGSLEEVQSLVNQGLALAQTPDLKAFGYFLLADVYNRERQPDKMRAALEKANSFKSKQGGRNDR